MEQRRKQQGGFAFGQVERLTSRLRQLIHDYPEGLGIIKELLQNADDAGARVLRLTFDWRIHRAERLPDERMKALQGPALLAFNDRKFTSDDLDNIREISRGGKLKSAAKTGRFGVGFNALYNLTDWPAFLTGDRVIVFDPHRSAVASPDGEEPGHGWILGEDQCWDRFPDFVAPFEAGGLPTGTDEFDGTIFRLPLRTSEQARRSEIKKVPFRQENAQAIIDELTRTREQLLLFLKSIEELHVSEIASDGSRRELLSIVTTNPTEIRAQRERLLEQLHGDSEEVLARLETGEISEEPVAYRHEFSIRRDGRNEEAAWQVVSGLFSDEGGELIEAARELDKAVPWAGVAARVSGKRLRIKGQLYCSLPLPPETGLPVHIHGFFDLNSNRSALMTEEGQTGADRKRGRWNRLLVNRAVASAYAILIESLATTLDDDRATDLYALWPQQCPINPIDELPEHVARELAERPVIRSAGDPRWCSFDDVTRLDPKWRELQEPLVRERISIADPPLPEHVVKLIDSAGVPVTLYTPEDLRNELRTHGALGVAVKDAPRPCLRRREWIESLLQFCISDKSTDLVRLPLALRADGRLDVIGAKTLYLADSRQMELFAGTPEWFLDTKFAERCGLEPNPQISIVSMTPETVVAQLRHIIGRGGEDPVAWNPDQTKAPNARWLRRVVEYLTAAVEDGFVPDREAMRLLALVPGSDGYLHAPALAETPLLAGEDADPETLSVLAAFGVPVVSAPKLLLRTLSTFARTLPNYIYPLTAPDAVDTLADRGELPARPRADHRRLLNFLAEDRWLSGDRVYDEEQKTKLGALPLFPAGGGEWIALGEDVYRPAHTPPTLSGSLKLLDLGPSNRWLPLYEFLDVPPLDAKTLIERFILPRYSQLDAAGKLEALSWIRDHLDTALTELDAVGGDSANLITQLGNAPLLLAGDGEYHVPRRIYDPRSEIVKAVLGEEVPMPDMRHYLGGSIHWLGFFARLGMVSRPKGPDLIRRIAQLVQQAKTDGVTQPIRTRLTAIYTHIAEHWADLKDAVIPVPHPKKFAEFLKEMRWLPVERNPKELEQWASEFIPEDRLHAPHEVHLGQNASLVASQRPIFRSRPPDPAMREALAFPKQVEKELLLKHFEAVIELWQRAPARLAPERWTSVLNAIYRELNRFVSDDEDGDSEEAEAIKARFAESACLWSGTGFWKPEHAFQGKIPFFGPRRIQLRPSATLLPAYKLLGLRSEPGLEDFTAYFDELADELPNRSLPEVEIANALAAYRKLGEELRGTDFRDASLIVLTASGKLKPASEVFVGDAYWHEERITPGAVMLLHPDLPGSIREAGQVRSLTAAIVERPIGVPEEIDSSRWSPVAGQWQERIRSIEFRRALQRLILHEGGASRANDLDWLEEVSIRLTAPIATDLLIPDDRGELVKVGGGAAGDAYFDPNLNTIFLNVEGEELMRTWLAQKLAQQLDDTPVKNLSPLEALLGCNPNEMETRLDRLRIRRLQVPEPLAEADAEVEDNSSAEVPSEPDPESSESGESSASAEVGDAESSSDEEDGTEAPTTNERPRRATTRRTPSGPSQQGSSASGGRPPDAPRAPRPAPASGVRQDRVVTYVTSGDPVPEEDDDTDDERTPEERQFKIRLGRLAVACVCKYERQHHRVPVEMSQTHPGYDVESTDPATQAVRLIEVKAINGPWGVRGVALSRTQFAASQTHEDNFWLYVVEHAGDEQNAVIHPIRNPAKLIGQYWFDQGWRALRVDEDSPPGAEFTKGRKMEIAGIGAGSIENIEERGAIRLIGLRLDSGDLVKRPFNPSTMRLLD